MHRNTQAHAQKLIHPSPFNQQMKCALCQCMDAGINTSSCCSRGSESSDPTAGKPGNTFCCAQTYG